MINTPSPPAIRYFGREIKSSARAPIRYPSFVLGGFNESSINPSFWQRKIGIKAQISRSIGYPSFVQFWINLWRMQRILDSLRCLFAKNRVSPNTRRSPARFLRKFWRTPYRYHSRTPSRFGFGCFCSFFHESNTFLPKNWVFIKGFHRSASAHSRFGRPDSRRYCGLVAFPNYWIIPKNREGGKPSVSNLGYRQRFADRNSAFFTNLRIGAYARHSLSMALLGPRIIATFLKEFFLFFSPYRIGPVIQHSLPDALNSVRSTICITQNSRKGFSIRTDTTARSANVIAVIYGIIVSYEISFDLHKIVVVGKRNVNWLHYERRMTFFLYGIVKILLRSPRMLSKAREYTLRSPDIGFGCLDMKSKINSSLHQRRILRHDIEAMPFYISGWVAKKFAHAEYITMRCGAVNREVA